MMWRMRSGLGAYSSTKGVNSALPRVSTYNCGAVQVAVDFVQVEQVERDLILHDGEVGAILRGQFSGLEVGQAVAEFLVERALAGEVCGAVVVQHLVEFLLLYWCRPAEVAEDGEKAREP